MKNKAVKIGAGVIGVAALGWSGLWFAGKSEIESRLDQEIAAQKITGTDIAYTSRSVSGFPFGYEVALNEVTATLEDGAHVLRFPTLVTTMDASDVTRAVTTLPPTFTIETAGPSTDDGAEPARLLFEVEAEAGAVTFSGTPGVSQTVELVSKSLLVTHEETDTKTVFAVELVDVATSTDVAGDGALSTSGTISMIDYALSGVTDGGQRMTLESQTDSVQFAGSSTIGSLAEVEEMMAGTTDHTVSANYVIGSTVTSINVEGGDTPGGILKMQSGALSAILEMADGVLDLRGESRSSAWELIPSDETVPVRGVIAVDMLDAIYKVPFAPTVGMQDFDVKVAIIGLQPDEQIWSVLDQTSVLDRRPANLTVDVEGTMRLTKPQSEQRPGEAPPVEFGNLRINTLKLDALGAGASAVGDIEFLQPVNLPQGEVKVTLSKVSETMAKLVEAKILTPDVLLFSGIMLQTYMQQDAETGDLTGLLKMGPDGITLNGQPLGALGGLQ